MFNRPPKLTLAAIAALLFAVNAFICWKLFFVEYLNQMASIEGAFIAFARYIMTNRGEMAWWPLWFNGMPYQNVYGPMFHHLVAGVAMALRISPALAFHATAAMFYCLGPVTLFWMAYRFTGSRACGFWAGLLYSCVSPSAWLIAAIRADIGGPFYLRRLHNIVVWGEQPHIAALAMAPLELLALDAALGTRKPAYYALAALSLACLALTNVTGSVGFAMVLAAYLLAKRPSIARVAWIGLLAYALAAPWIPPSTLRQIVFNSRHSAGNSYPVTPWHAFYFILIAGAGAGLWMMLERWRLHWFPRFALLLTFFSAAIVLPGFWLKIAVIPQPERFQLEFEMGCCLAAAYAMSRVGRAPGAVLAVLCLASIVYNRRHADKLIQPIDIHGTAEYKEAMWFDQHMGGRRVFAPGSVSFWLNVFSDTPQIGGCCDQGVPNWQQLVALYVIYIGENAGARDAEISLLWLKAFGVHAIGMSGPGAGEHYKPFTNPRKFDGILRELWRDGGDAIYEVPQRSPSLAHLIRESQIVSRGPIHGLDVDPLRPFVAALDDPQLPVATFEWETRSRAKIVAIAKPGEVVSVQIAYHPGWHAVVNGAERRIAADAIGLMVIHPECDGACKIDLVYDGGAEMKIARGIQAISAMLCLGLGLSMIKTR